MDEAWGVTPGAGVELVATLEPVALEVKPVIGEAGVAPNIEVTAAPGEAVAAMPLAGLAVALGLGLTAGVSLTPGLRIGVALGAGPIAPAVGWALAVGFTLAVGVGTGDAAVGSAPAAGGVSAFAEIPEDVGMDGPDVTATAGNMRVASRTFIGFHAREVKI